MGDGMTARRGEGTLGELSEVRRSEALDRQRAGLLLAEQVLEWARTPGNHGGNPYVLPFVATAEKIIEGKVT